MYSKSCNFKFEVRNVKLSHVCKPGDQKLKRSRRIHQTSSVQSKQKFMSPICYDVIVGKDILAEQIHLTIRILTEGKKCKTT